jgi:hypothetical protein
MSIRNQNWYNLQSTRRYPLDDISTGVDDAGAFIRDDIIVDCHIRFPNTLGTYLYVQGVTVSAGIVTVLFGVANTVNATTGTTIAAVSVAKPVAPYVHYNISGLVAGVSGWVVFGPGVTENFVGRYTTPKQTLLQPRSARAYRPLPIPTLGKLNLGTALQGVVTLLGSTPITAKYELITYSGRTYPAIVFRLDTTDLSLDYNSLSQFLGPCSQRPESDTCPRTPIETINGIAPDCNGNINIEFDGFDEYLFSGCGGMNILTPVSLETICDSNKPKKPTEFSDACCNITGQLISSFPSFTDFPIVGEAGRLYSAADTNKIYRWETDKYAATDIVADEYCWGDPTLAIDEFVDETLDRLNYPCITAPLCVDFISCDPGFYFTTFAGAFVQGNTLAPASCGNCANTTFVPLGPSTALTNHGTYLTSGISSVNIALLKNCATDWALGRAVTTELKITPNGLARNGGLVLNYVQTKEINQVINRYIAVVIDATRSRIRVLRYTNTSFVEETSVYYPAKVNAWYRLSAALNLNGSSLNVSFSVAELDNTNQASGFTSLSNPGAVTGAVGLFANQAATHFNKLTVQ